LKNTKAASQDSCALASVMIRIPPQGHKKVSAYPLFFLGLALKGKANG
jgi:hypothetical protein